MGGERLPHRSRAGGLIARRPAGTEYEPPAMLIARAEQAGLTVELDRACIESALRSYHGLALEGRLFLNLLPQTLRCCGSLADWLADAFAAQHVDPHDVVLEITEHGTEDESRIAAAVRPLRALGCDIAIDDLGSGSSGLKAWAEVRPDYVKVDRYFVSGIERDAVRTEILRSLVDMGRVTGCRVIAEGIENRAQCAIVLDQGVDYLQGYYLSRPRRVPEFNPEVLSGLEAGRAAPAAGSAEDLLLPVPPIPADTPVAAVTELFREHPGWSALAVIEASGTPRPIGIVYRDQLLIFLSRPLRPEIFNRRPVTSVMTPDPMLIESRARLEQVGRMVTARPAEQQREEFIITRGGRYLGLGRAMDLLRQLTAQQIQMAMHCNPLTGLPGNLQIQTQLSQWVQRRRFFVACHLDIDHFKPYNDQYGYARGDQVLLHVSQVIARSVRQPVDFVGHVGGDDFVCLLRSQDWQPRLTAMIEELAASLLNFHLTEHRLDGGFEGHDREGGRRRFPLLAVSIGAVEVDGLEPVSAEAVLESLREMKILAKSRSGSSCLLLRRGRIVDLAGAAAIEAAVPQTEHREAQPLLLSA